MKTPIYFEVGAVKWVKNAYEFNMSTHQTSIQYEKILNLYIPNIHKLRIKLSEDRGYIFSPPVEMFPFVIISKNFDFNTYWKATENERKTIILETLQESVLDMCEKMNLDKTPFEKAYREVQSILQIS